MTTDSLAPASQNQDSLPPCPVRHIVDPESGWYFCGHPQVHVANDLVSAAICRSCTRHQEPPTSPRPFPTKILLGRNGPCAFLGPMTGLRECPTCTGKVQLKVFRCDHHRHQETTLGECTTCYDYEPPLSLGGVRTWAIGVLAGPGKSGPIAGSWLARAGFDLESANIFRSQTDLCEWSRFYLALAEVYQRSPLADAFVMVRGGVELAPNLRPYLESALWPAKSLGFIVLDGVTDSDSSGATEFRELAVGTLPARMGALVFSNTSLRLFLGSTQAIDHRLRPQSASLDEIEPVLDRWSQDYGLKIFAHTPPLARPFAGVENIFSGCVSRRSLDRSTDRADG